MYIQNVICDCIPFSYNVIGGGEQLYFVIPYRIISEESIAPSNPFFDATAPP